MSSVAEQQLAAIVTAPRYKGGSEVTSLASSIESAAGHYASASESPGWTGISALAASQHFGTQHKRALHNSERLREVSQAIDQANAAIDSAEHAFHALPDFKIGASVIAAIQGGQTVQIAPWGIFTTVVGIVTTARKVAATRDREASQALSRLKQELDSVARQVKLNDMSLQAPNSLMPPSFPLQVPSHSEPDEYGFRIGPPERPDIEWDEDFEYGSDSPTADDYKNAAYWRAKMLGARAIRWDLDDGLDAYAHYWSNTGDPFVFDYDEAYDEDPQIRRSVDDAIARAQQSANGYIEQGQRDFAITGPPVPSAYPETENWQKAVGGHQQWSSADIVVNGDEVTMTVTVHAEDYYNFNRGQQDIETGQPDDANGRFTEVGWAKPFENTGELTRVVTWNVNDPGAVEIETPPSSSRR